MNVAQTTIREAYLSSEFGLNLALKWTGLTEEEIAKYLGRNKKGKRKGLLKGSICWLKVDSGGWVRFGGTYGNGGVENRKGKVIVCVLRDCWNEDLQPKFFRVETSIPDDHYETLDRYWEYKLKREVTG
jgi:hypothetical protein